MIEELKRRIVEGGSITPKEAEALASVPERDALCDAADEIRRHFCGNEIDTCSIANARSGKCGEDCKWCAQSKHFSTGVKEYERIGTTQLVQLAQGYDRIGVNRFSLVTSGRKVAPKDAAAFCDDYKLLAKETTLSLCASMGLVDEDTLRALKAAGVSRYHCNMETSSEFFPSLCTTHTPDDKRRVIRAARAAGMTVCSGGIIGMGETMSDRIQMAFELRALEVDSVPINILNPIKGTPLEHVPAISEDEIIRTVAVFRFILPLTTLRFAGGRARLSRATVKRILQGGMNGVMIGDLLTTAGNDARDDFRLFEECGFQIKKQLAK